MADKKPEQPSEGGRYYRLTPGGPLLTEAEYLEQERKAKTPRQPKAGNK